MSTEIEQAEVIGFNAKQPSIHDNFMSKEFGRQDSFLVVWLNFVDRNIRTKLPNREAAP